MEAALVDLPMRLIIENQASVPCLCYVIVASRSLGKPIKRSSVASREGGRDRVY